MAEVEKHPEDLGPSIESLRVGSRLVAEQASLRVLPLSLCDSGAWVPETLRGDLDIVPTFALLQMIDLAHRTGVLDLESDGRRGRIWFEGGVPVDAESESLVGFAAAVELMTIEQGSFSFQPRMSISRRTIDEGTVHLLLESARHRDEIHARSAPGFIPG